MFKVAGPLWAQATAGADNVFARLVKTGKKVLRRVLQKEIEPTTVREIPKPTWSLRAQTVKVEESASGRLIGGLFPKQALKTQAAELRKQAALRLVRDARKVPVFAFVGLSLGLGGSTDQKAETDDVLCSGIRDLFQQHGGKGREVEVGGQHFSLQTLHLGQLIGQGCNAAVFEAKSAASCHEAGGEEEREEADDREQTDVSVDQPVEGTESQTALDTDDNDSCTDGNWTFLSACTEEDSDSDDDDISIISEDEETGTEENVDGWVLYRLSSVSPPSSSAEEGEGGDASDDSDIIILAGDEDNLQSLPDLEDVASEFSWSVVRGPSLEADSGGRVSLDTADLGDPPSTTTDEVPQPAPSTPHGEGEFPLAVKMMYNYSVESKADHILSAMARETLPAMSLQSQPSDHLHSSVSVMKSLPPHPNIVTMYDVFVDQTPDRPEGAQQYPSALPPRLNREGGCGRNATMFLVMKKYTMTLSEYLSASHPLPMRTRCLLFTQLLEGVAHLSQHGVAHRDLKSNNLLVDLSDGTDCPHLAITDFGSCLADSHYGLKVPYPTADTDRGGNSALMAPEIKCAVSGPDSILDYSRADIWAVGTLGYEIFGEGNPFYNGYDSRSYCEDDLPELPGDTPELMVRLVKAMLKRNPSERPSAAVAATCLELFLWAPPDLQPFTPTLLGGNSLWRYKEITHWLQQLTMETVCQRVFGGRVSRLDLQLKSTFLSRISRQDIWGVVAFSG